MGYNPLLISEEQFTTPSIIEELHPKTAPYTRLNLALEARKLKVNTPSVASLKEVEEAAYRIGDITTLSRADKDIIAVSLDLSKNGYSPHIVSDDYAIQNVAEFFNLKYISLTTFGIRYRFRWILYCPACKKTYAPDKNEAICGICGTQLKRKGLKRRKAIGKQL
jgi:UPF0271 protein